MKALIGYAEELVAKAQAPPEPGRAMNHLIDLVICLVTYDLMYRKDDVYNIRYYKQYINIDAT